MASSRSSRPPSPHGTGGGEGIFSLLSSLAFMVAVGVWWWEQAQRERSARPRPRPLSEEERTRREVEWAKVHAREMELRREDEERARASRRELWKWVARGGRDLLLSGWSGFRYLFLFGWFRDLPDWLQAIAMGLVFAIPGIVLIVLLFRGT